VTAKGGAPLTGVVSLALGARHSCALKDNGIVVCWGANDTKQLGSPSLGTTPSAIPVQASINCGQ
jgi:alpha-tubulin suppressor-like RCC1 family protein